MIIHNIIYDQNNSWCNNHGEFSEYDLSYLKPEPDEIWYWYNSGSYEGSGQLLVRKGEKYGLFDMSHCSCYGPTECYDESKVTFTLEEIEKSCSSDYLKDVKPLLVMAKK